MVPEPELVGQLGTKSKGALYWEMDLDHTTTHAHTPKK